MILTHTSKGRSVGLFLTLTPVFWTQLAHPPYLNSRLFLAKLVVVMEL